MRKPPKNAATRCRKRSLQRRLQDVGVLRGTHSARVPRVFSTEPQLSWPPMASRGQGPAAEVSSSAQQLRLPPVKAASHTPPERTARFANLSPAAVQADCRRRRGEGFLLAFLRKRFAAVWDPGGVGVMACDYFGFEADLEFPVPVGHR